MTMLTTPAQIDAFRLASLRAAVKLEIYGMTRRGKSATSIAKQTLGLPRNMSRELVFAALNSAVMEARYAEAVIDSEVEGY